MTGYRIKSGMTWLRCLVAAVISETEVCRQIDEAGHAIHYYNISRRLEIGISIAEGSYL
jgi:hypothetical protein